MNPANVHSRARMVAPQMLQSAQRAVLQQQRKLGRLVTRIQNGRIVAAVAGIHESKRAACFSGKNQSVTIIQHVTESVNGMMRCCRANKASGLHHTWSKPLRRQAREWVEKQLRLAQAQAFAPTMWWTIAHYLPATRTTLWRESMTGTPCMPSEQRLHPCAKRRHHARARIGVPCIYFTVRRCSSAVKSLQRFVSA